MRPGTVSVKPILLVGGVLALVLTGCPVAQRQDTPVSERLCAEPQTRAKYYLYVPSDYNRRRPLPMVVTLHGTHGFDSARDQVREWKYLAETNGFIVLAPRLLSPQGILPVVPSARRGDLAKDEKRVLAAIGDVKRRYSVDERAVMITGFSAGGYPLYYIALRNPRVFSVLIARACNCDMEILRSIPITDEVRDMAMLIFFSKTGINPISSALNPIANESWAAFRHLRENRCYKAEIDAVSGGHHRRPDLAYAFWRKNLPESARP